MPSQVKLLFPLKGYTHQSLLVHLERHPCANYGEPRARAGGVLDTHKGVDLYGNLGQPVFNIRRGKVWCVNEFYRGSWAIWVTVGAGHVYCYGELFKNSIRPRAGEVVEEGAILGKLADLGLEGYPSMLHFEETMNGEHINPMGLLLKCEART